jgi:hypothetical protein
MTEQEHWELQGESLGIFLHDAFGPQQPLLSSDAAGVVPYYAHMPALDPLGLNDYHIAHEASRARGYGWVGHELGDGKYILDQKPDLLLFSSFEGDGPLFPADEQIIADPRFAQYYQAVRFDTPAPNSIRALMYLRRVDGKLGIEQSDGRVVVPAYLEKVDLENSVHLLDGKAVLTIAPRAQATFEAIPVTQGNWNVSVDGSSNQIELRLVDGNASLGPCIGCDAGRLVVKGQAARVSLALVNPQNTPVTVSSITLLRKP